MFAWGFRISLSESVFSENGQSRAGLCFVRLTAQRRYLVSSSTGNLIKRRILVHSRSSLRSMPARIAVQSCASLSMKGVWLRLSSSAFTMACGYNFPAIISTSRKRPTSKARLHPVNKNVVRIILSSSFGAYQGLQKTKLEDDVSGWRQANKALQLSRFHGAPVQRLVRAHSIGWRLELLQATAPGGEDNTS